MTGRLEWVDRARGIGIALVVVGHVLAGLLASGQAGAAREPLDEATAFIYRFHMPLFFVLAGLFAPRALGRGGRGFFGDKLSRLIWPYFLWALLQTLVQIALAGSTNTAMTWADLPRLAYAPPMQFWFLPCLFFCFAAAWVAARARLGVAGVAAAFFGLCGLLVALDPAAGSVPGRFRDNAPYFAQGCLLAPHVGRVAAAPAAALELALVFGAVGNAALGGVQVDAVAVRWFLAWPGVVMVVAAATLAARMGAEWLGLLGRHSLEIYLAHVLAYAGVRVALLRLGADSLAVQLAAQTAAGLLVPLALARAAAAVHADWLYAWPARRAVAA